MSRQRKTWKEKMDNGREPEVDVLPKAFAGAPAGGTLLVSTPREVDREIRSIPVGTAMSVADLRHALARKHGADTACPTSTSIFVRICAECALEELAAGADPKSVTPFWRVVDSHSPIAGRLSCGPDRVAALRTAEGLSP